VITHQDPIRRNNVKTIGNLDASRAMLFVHGFGTDQTVWSEVADAFLPDFRIVLVDNVGAGHSAPEAFVQSQYLNLQSYATDLLEVCDAMSLTDVILVGHSAGAMIGVLAATKRPPLFSKLVLIGSSPRYLNDRGYHGGFSNADLDELYSLMTLDYDKWADYFAATAMGNADRPHLAKHFASCLKTIPADRALTVLCSIFQSDYRFQLPLVTQPTLILQSREDIAVPLEVAEYIHTEIKGSRLSVINATGHFPHVSAPSIVIAEIRAFVD
jgi:sigma-B regulation protein RsbQ